MMEAKRTKKNKRKAERKDSPLTPVKVEAIDVTEAPTPPAGVAHRSFESPDVMWGSQECFRINWDWSGQGGGCASPIAEMFSRRQNPKIPKVKKTRFEDPPACLRPRRLLENHDINIHDMTGYKEELLSLAVGLNRSTTEVSAAQCNEHFSTVGSKVQERIPPSTVDLQDMKSHSSDSSKSENFNDKMGCADNPQCKNPKSLPRNKVQGSAQNVKFLDPRESLCDLLDDSLGDDIMLRCSQELDQEPETNHDPCVMKTPVLQSKRTTTGSSKKRPSLSLKKSNGNPDQKGRSAARRINGLDSDVATSSTVKDSRDERIYHHNPCTENKFIMESDGFDDFDDFDDILLSVALLQDEKIPVATAVKGKPGSSSALRKDQIASSNQNADIPDDFLATPDVLDFIDSKASAALGRENQKFGPSTKTAMQNPSRSRPVGPLERKMPYGSTLRVKETGTAPKSASLAPVMAKLSAPQEAYAPRSQCTPEEIEQKRQEALQKRRKRLQLRR